MTPSVQANTEINNFGPVLCRSDAVGHLAFHAAQTVAKEWPILTPSLGGAPAQFLLAPSARSDTESAKGAWIVLDLANGQHQSGAPLGAETTLTPQDIASRAFPLTQPTDDPVEPLPRDLWVRNIWRQLRWSLTKRYTLRASFSANFPASVRIDVHTPQEMLRAGRVSWKADPTNPTTTSDASQLGSESLEGLDEDFEEWPCPHLYAHIQADYQGVPLQAPNANADVYARLGEAYMGKLAPERAQEEHALPSIPILLVLEPLHAGVVPHTALSLLGVLLPVLALAWALLVPTLLRAARDAVMLPHHDKTD